MSYHLYSFTLKANWPVALGEIIFFTKVYYTDEEAKVIGRGLAALKGFKYAMDDDQNIEYLGVFIPHREFKDNILTYENGEY